MQSYEKAIGIDVELKVYETGTFESMRLGKTFDQMTLHWQSSYGDILKYPSQFADPNHGRNISKIDLPVYTKMYQEAAQLYNPGDRDKLLKAAYDMNLYLLEQAYQINMPIPSMLRVWQPWVGGYAGEGCLGTQFQGSLLARIWIDQKLKKDTGH